MKLTGLDKKLVNLEGTELDMTYGKALANVLLIGGKVKFDHHKAYSLSKKFYDEKEFSMDRPDFKNLKEVIEADGEKEGTFKGSLIYGQLEEYLGAVK